MTLYCHLAGGTEGSHVIAQVLCLHAKMRAEDLRWKVGILNSISPVHFHFLLEGFTIAC